MQQYQIQHDGSWRSPDVYWSHMLDGTNPMTEIEERTCGLPHPTVSGYAGLLGHDPSEDNQILEFYQACGFDPNSDELAHHFNLPLIEVLPCKPYPLHCVNVLTRMIHPANPVIPRRRHSISNIAEFTMQVHRQLDDLPISIRKITNDKLSTADIDWMG